MKEIFKMIMTPSFYKISLMVEVDNIHNSSTLEFVPLEFKFLSNIEIA